MGDGVKLDSIGHIGLVVKDIEAATKSWSSLLGIGPWTIRDVGDNKLAFATLGGVNIELIEPVAKDTLWADFLNTQGEGLHHICGRVPDVGDAVAKLKEEGSEVLLSHPGFAYLNTKGPGSILLELLTTPGT